MTAPPEGPVLALDTSTNVGSVAVGEGDRLLAEILLTVGSGHSSALLPAVDRALRSAGLEAGELAGVAVGGGPGSFTGVRIAAATAKGIVHAAGVPMFAYSSLLAAAAGCWGADRPVCALFDARRRDVYAACYRFGAGVEVVMAPVALTLDEVLDRFRGGPSTLFTGEAAVIHREEIEREKGARVVPAQLATPRASALLALLRAEPAVGRVAEPAHWEPDYVRASGAERIAAAAGRAP
ncbi:MAG TPA: tRNA (adenosine(37)-N6)-threonylcarbamoyltransferase complex dimerization subunit type 1 TsaB [Longimicrobiaceae bacterium]|nr:tRNA (adenosine(37)-N6)-threonylcarbamoyltransferase complex dimerization subunit type 1 TsaB [Longimicrobiaceae bacterium]